MATSQQLKKRWTTFLGGEKARLVLELLEARGKTTAYKDAADLGPINKTLVAQLLRRLDGLPFIDEVAPALDLRGFTFDRRHPLRNIDFSGVRFDHADLGCNVSDCRMVGAVFDFATASRLMRHDFSGASFVGAKLNRACFSTTLLSQANFARASLRNATLEKAVCRGATFAGADLFSSMCAYADFRGADLSGANFSQATLGGVRFDNATRVNGGDFRDASLDRAFEKFVAARGGATGADAGRPLADFDGTLARLAEANRGGKLDSVIARMKALRPKLIESGCNLDWRQILCDEISMELYEVVEDCWNETQE